MRERRERERERRNTLSCGVMGSNPEPADAKLTPVISSSIPSFGSKYGGRNSFLRPRYEAVIGHTDKINDLIAQP